MLFLDTASTVDPNLTPGTRFRDGPHLPEMVVVPPGKFWMGACDDEDRFAGISEKPRHWVEITRPLAVGRYPITFEEWDAFAEADSFAHQPEDRGWGRGRLPVLNVSWEDAESYVSWLSANTSRPYRLISEAEWEFCCRAGSSSVFSTGTGISVEQANFLQLDFGTKPGKGRPLPVGSYPPNAYGLYDMHGNVCELVADSWHDNYQGAPSDGSAWEETSANIWRVVRNGGWDALPRILRTPFRDLVHHTQRLDNMGFRVACSLD
jgi:formylglycine-generating enzyme required for sulfatase activity